MEKSYVINRIKELCNKKNDREIWISFIIIGYFMQNIYF